MTNEPSTEQKTFVVVSHRPWNRSMSDTLSNRIGSNFHLIDKPADLTPEWLSDIDPAFVFFPHWSFKIPPEIFERFCCVVFHMTDLPFGRGGSPLQNLIASGMSDTMITALECAAALDAGPVYCKRPLNLNGSAEEIYIRASRIIEDMIVEIIQNRPEPKPQVGAPTHFKRRRPGDGDLRNVSTLEAAFDLIRMLDAEGYPNAFVDIGKFRLEFSRVARHVEDLEADVKIRLRKTEEQ